MEPVRIGVIGCGAICGAYLDLLRNFSMVRVLACADLDLDKARQVSERFGVGRACSVEEVLKDDAIELVLNLTVPKAHAPVTLACIERGKHVYVEKPLGTTREEGRKVMEAARAKGVRIGSAPDTFLGAGLQTARQLIEEGAIGQPVAFTAFLFGRGHEHWHPNPEFFYEPGGGPMLDMGPYYLTALMNLLGPIKRLTGLASISRPQRTILHRDRAGNPGPKFGRTIEVRTPDHVTGSIEFENGCVGSIITSFAMRGPVEPSQGTHPIALYGTHGALRVPDPNGFDGSVLLCRFQDDAPEVFVEVPHRFVKGYGRGVGVADLAVALRTGRHHRANGEQALAVLDVLAGFLDSSGAGRAYVPLLRYLKPARMPAHLPFGQLDE